VVLPGIVAADWLQLRREPLPAPGVGEALVTVEATGKLGVIPIDYRRRRSERPRKGDRVREIAPGGVDAVFDHLGGESVHRSHRLLAPRGTLVSYAIASRLDDPGTGSLLLPFVALMTLPAWSNWRPDGYSASFYNIWSGHGLRPRLQKPPPRGPHHGVVLAQ